MGQLYHSYVKLPGVQSIDHGLSLSFYKNLGKPGKYGSKVPPLQSCMITKTKHIRSIHHRYSHHDIYIYMDSMDMEIWNDMDQNLVPQLLNGGSSLKRLKSFKSVVFQVFNGLTQAIDSIDHPRFRRATIFQLGDVVESSHVYVNYIYTILYTYIYMAIMIPNVHTHTYIYTQYPLAI